MEPADLSQLLLPIQGWDHVKGPADAAYTLVEYGDYQCPACGDLYRLLAGLQSEIGDCLRIAYRHYPLSGLHRDAQKAAEAAEAAGAQGKFWEMHSLLFENQQSLREKNLIGYAEKLALDVRRFRGDLKHESFSDRVRENFRAGVQNGVFTTPGLFLNGIRQNGAWDERTIREAIR